MASGKRLMTRYSVATNRACSGSTASIAAHGVGMPDLMIGNPAEFLADLKT
jgi:hypothetical protein